MGPFTVAPGQDLEISYTVDNEGGHPRPIGERIAYELATGAFFFYLTFFDDPGVLFPFGTLEHFFSAGRCNGVAANDFVQFSSDSLAQLTSATGSHTGQCFE